MEDHSEYVVLYPEESLSFGGSPSSVIPSIGTATTAIDQYRIVAVALTNLPEAGAAFTDVEAVVAVTKIAEGGISSVEDLEAAEVALQALLLHDIVHVAVPSPKIDHGNGLITYLRKDALPRTPFGFELFSVAKSRDWLIAPERLKLDGQSIVASTLPASPFVGRSIEALRSGTYSHSGVLDAINVAIESHGVAGYFSNPDLMRSRRGDGFQKRFYHRLRKSWEDAVGDLPPIVCTFSLPPLLAVVLDRSNNRSDLKKTLQELREELAPVRSELRSFNEIVIRSVSNAEIERRVRHITESFNAILPESRLSSAERRQRKLLSIQRLSRPLIKLAMGFLTTTGATLEDGLQAAKGASGLIFESDALVDRTVTARTFVDLVKTESLQSLIKQHFRPSEIEAIERSLRVRTLG